jgi:hypothetical protein
MKPFNLVDLVDGVQLERLVHGLLVFGLQESPDFRARLCQKSRRPGEYPRIRREVVDDDARHDIVLDGDGAELVVELKLWSGFTRAQYKRLRNGGIDLVIAPLGHIGALRKSLEARQISEPLPPFLTWNEVEGLARGTSAELLLRGVAAWVQDGWVLNEERVVRDLDAFASKNGEGWLEVYRFFLWISAMMEDEDRIGKITGGGTKSGWYGRYVYVKRGPGLTRARAWTGFLWRPGDPSSWIWTLQPLSYMQKPVKNEHPDWAPEPTWPPGWVLWKPGDSPVTAEEMASRILRKLRVRRKR